LHRVGSEISSGAAAGSPVRIPIARLGGFVSTDAHVPNNISIGTFGLILIS